MNMMSNDLRAGDWVVVKAPIEIALTLDATGTLDGLPFMPEMLDYCGQQFRVERIAEKTCIEFPGGGYKIREFRQNNVVLLEGLRCSGAAHDGCQRACMLFWKAQWLRKADAVLPAATDSAEQGVLISRLRTKVEGGRYFCQSTELSAATQKLTRSRILLKSLRDVRSGSRGALEMVWLMLAPLWRKITQKVPRRRLIGELGRTPVGDLHLQPGEWVEIRPVEQVAQTLDKRGRNRGLTCDFGMTQYGGKGPYKVRTRLDRMISEATGQMRQVEGTVILDNLHCLCWNVFGGCPRRDFMYWREVWLTRASACGTNEASSFGATTGTEDPVLESAVQSTGAETSRPA